MAPLCAGEEVASWATPAPLVPATADPYGSDIAVRNVGASSIHDSASGSGEAERNEAASAQARDEERKSLPVVVVAGPP